MGIIDKYDLDRLGGADVELAFNCPCCKKSRLVMSGEEDIDFWEGIECPKCHSKIILDSFSLAVIRKNGVGASGERTERAGAFITT